MAYSTSSPPSIISQGLASSGTPRLWMYASTDAATAVRVAGYITNGDKLGMKKGDIVMSVKTDASPISVQFHIVSAVTAGGSADLSDGTAITATNTD